MTVHALTTADNPFNPFVDFNDWFAFDSSKGYNTIAFLARVVVSSDELSEADQHQAFELGIDEILETDVTGLYLRVTENTRILQLES